MQPQRDFSEKRILLEKWKPLEGVCCYSKGLPIYGASWSVRLGGLGLYHEDDNSSKGDPYSHLRYGRGVLFPVVMSIEK